VTVAVRGRQVGVVIVALIVAAVCVRLGFWQMHRLQGREQINAMLAERGAQPARDIEGADPASLPYAHVTATGNYDPAHEVILSGRTFNETPGNHVLTPLVLGDGTAVLVDRGWVPLDVATPPVTGLAAAPSGTVRVEGLALSPDAISEPAASPAPSITTRIDLGISGLPYRLLPVYVLLASQQPPQASPTAVSPPGFDNGPHLSYMLQWFTFATIAIVGGVVLLVRDQRPPAPAR
jgi:cytochrome oxidase assembly protein ShyY1